MFFFVKPSKLVVEALISEKNYYIAKETPPFLSSPKHVDWWKNLPKSSFDFENMQAQKRAKSCVGIVNHLRAGIILPLWCDFAFKIRNSEWAYQFSDYNTNIVNHSNEQIIGFYENYFIFKIVSPWVLRCKQSNVKFLLADPFYYRTEPLPFILAPGINELYDKNIATHFFWMVNKNNSFETIIDKHTPVTQFIPLTEKSVDLKIKIIDDKDFDVLNKPVNLTFSSGGYKKLRYKNNRK